jgi:XTP/dITP diphosphohydrolase
MERPRLVLATRNDHKLRELAEILDGVALAPLPPGVELPPETGDTFAENALIKARAAREATGAATIADDSGIVAYALGGRPAKLIAELAGAVDHRVAYVCVIAYIDGSGAEHLFEGRCEGELVSEPRGSGGFGYDPAFVPIDTGEADSRTMAELAPAEKHAISHRGRAGRMLARHLGSDEPEAPG